jgi:hypothetical protein
MDSQDEYVVLLPGYVNKAVAQNYSRSARSDKHHILEKKDATLLPCSKAKRTGFPESKNLIID